MTRNTRLWFATFSALVFAIGLLAGLMLDRTWLLPAAAEIDNGPGRRGPRDGPRGRGLAGPSDNMAGSTISRLDRELRLSEAQKRDLLILLDAWDARMRKAQDAVQQQFRDEQQTLHQEVLKVLTPEQAARFEASGGRMLQGPTGRTGRGPFSRGRGGPDRE